MVLRLFLLFTLVPVTELWLLLRLGRFVGPWATLALVLLTGILGAWLAQREGIRAWGRVQAELSAGRMPTGEILDALLVFVAGLVLLTPGFLTDVSGFVLLLPWGRSFVKDWIRWWWGRRAVRSGAVHSQAVPRGREGGRQTAGEGPVIELRPEDVVVRPVGDEDG